MVSRSRDPHAPCVFQLNGNAGETAPGIEDAFQKLSAITAKVLTAAVHDPWQLPNLVGLCLLCSGCCRWLPPVVLTLPSTKQSLDLATSSGLNDGFARQCGCGASRRQLAPRLRLPRYGPSSQSRPQAAGQRHGTCAPTICVDVVSGVQPSSAPPHAFPRATQIQKSWMAVTIWFSPGCSMG